MRTPYEAEQMFRRTVPAPVRNMGPRAVSDYVKDKHGSHIKSVSNAPGKAKSIDNFIWESAPEKPAARQREHDKSRPVASPRHE